MSKEMIEERRKALENAFFKKHNEQLLAKMRTERKKAALSEASGISDDDLLGTLAEEGLTAGDIAALSLIPLVRVAWADGRVAPSERRAVLAAAEEADISKGSTAHKLLESWLDEKPGRDLFTAWAAFVQSLPPDARKSLQITISQRATEVAKAAGGILGIGTLSPSEREALDEIEKAFA
jgi:uncharacterized tellurite resistance protein B-like protein